jgi:hypothetical protein
MRNTITVSIEGKIAGMRRGECEREKYKRANVEPAELCIEAA